MLFLHFGSFLIWFSIFLLIAGVDSAIWDYVQSQIVIVGDFHDIDLLYIVTEGGVIFQLPQEKKLWALTGLLGSFYTFNVPFNKSKAIFTFVEQELLEICYR